MTNLPMTASSPITSSRVIAADIKLSHSIFALPFALLAAFLVVAKTGGSVDWVKFSSQLLLIILAMISARTVAMLSNRILDRKIDATNPRTKNRAIPSGRLPLRHAITTLLTVALVFMLICLAFALFFGNWWPLILGIPVLLWIAVYPLLKRWTWACHLYLGSALALSPIAVAIAIEPNALFTIPAIWLIAGMVLCWVAGFDVIYALQDESIDRSQGISSIPARFGSATALWLSRLLHLLAVGFLVATVLIEPIFGLLFWIGIATVSALLLYEHLTVARWGTTRMALAFFTLNGIISCILGGLGIIDTLIN
ncbi:MAG: 4-hydroxybenzoate octaprenyltransferase [Phycisphaerales bacterium]|nr:4-hydroxybenzoate octaprenyltransferase [Phycisphaerales bacterium]